MFRHQTIPRLVRWGRTSPGLIVARKHLPGPVAANVCHASSLQSVTQPSFWVNLVPKPLRKSNLSKKTKESTSKEWNPATFYIWIFLLIGSMSIQMIALRNEHTAFTRRTDAKIGLLKEIIEKIQNGEDVDVEGLLGTGNPEAEKEWEEVIRDIEREDELWKESQKQSRQPSKTPATSVQGQGNLVKATLETPKEDAKAKTKSTAPKGFY